QKSNPSRDTNTGHFASGSICLGPEGAGQLSPGQRPGLSDIPPNFSALKGQNNNPSRPAVLPFQGEKFGDVTLLSQGVALGLVVRPLQGQEGVKPTLLSQGVALGYVVRPLQGREGVEAITDSQGVALGLVVRPLQGQDRSLRLRQWPLVRLVPHLV